MGMRLLVATLVLAVAGCAGSGTFRPAKDAPGFPPSADAYRVKVPQAECTELGYVIEAESLDDLIAATKRAGGTHYQILNDFGESTIETTTNGVVSDFGTVHARSSSKKVDHHMFTARVYHC